MKKFSVISLMILCICINADAEKINALVTVSADYEYLSDSRNETIAEAEHKAIERAKVKALEDAFGVDISNVSSTVLHNQNSGDDSQSNSDFYSLGLSSVQGEWIETISERLSEPVYKNGFISVKAYVKGKARSKTSEGVQIETLILRNGTEPIYKSDKFYSGDNIYVRFRSPVSGYVCIYLVDEESMAYCLLPDSHNTTGNERVVADKDYIFFSQKHAAHQIDEYELTATRQVEQNQLWIVFSPNGFYKASDHHTENNWLDMPMPRSLTYKNFMEWLAKNRTRDREMTVKMDVIKIFRK